MRYRRLTVQRTWVLVAAIAVLLAFGVAPASANSVAFGVNDNAGLYGDGVGSFWSTLLGVGLTSDTITLRWNEQSLDGFDGADGVYLPEALAAAQAAGVGFEFDVYPRHAAELADPAGPGKFGAFVRTLAQTYPQVTQYVVMNECNQDLFVNPQAASGNNVSAARCGAFLAAAYDALKAVNPSIFVWGLGLSPRGSDQRAGNPPSTDPIDWLGFLGAWYRSSGRSRPLMDGLDIHPYAVPQSLPFATGYANPHDFSVANLPRVYQAFSRAFSGSAQHVVGLAGRLPVQLNEVGIQTAFNGRPGYTGVETAATPEGGIVPPFDGERYQARWYASLIDLAECDADVRAVNIFKLVDETDLAGWQSGLYYLGYAPKLAAGAVRDEIARVAGHCPTGRPTYWTPPPVPGSSLRPAAAAAARLASRAVQA